MYKKNNIGGEQYGGVDVATELTCPKLSNAQCIKKLLDTQGFIRIKTPPDGNCFYHTLTKFLQLSQNSTLPIDYHMTIRNMVIDHMEQNIDNIIPYFIQNSNNTISNQLDVLRKNGVWNSEVGDIIIQYSAKALNMCIKIYDVQEPIKEHKKLLVKLNNENIYNIIPAQPRRIISYKMNPDINLGITIHMLRIDDGHFELLYPKNAGVMPPSKYKKTIKNKKNNKTIKNTKNNKKTKSAH